jgi:hypothetical protein
MIRDDRNGLGAEARKTKVNWTHCDVIMTLFQAIYVSKLHTPSRGSETDRWEAMATQMCADRIFANFKEFKGPALKKAFLNIIKDMCSERQNLSGKDTDQIACRDIVKKVGEERELFLTEKQAAIEKMEHDKAVKNDTMLGFENELLLGDTTTSSSSASSYSCVNSYVSPHGYGTRPSDPNKPSKYSILSCCLVCFCVLTDCGLCICVEG